MKVLHLIDSGGLYGAEKMLLTLAQEQIKLGREVAIISVGEPGGDEKPLETEAKRLGVPVKAWRMKPGFNFTGAREILKWAASEGVDLLHSHGYKFNILFGLMPKRMRKLPLISTVHGYTIKSGFENPKMWVYLLLDRYALTRVDSVAFVNPEMTKNKNFRHLNRATVIPNGISLQPESMPDNKQLVDFTKSVQPYVVCVGRLSKEKGLDVLFEAFAQSKLRDTMHLLVVGEGPEKAYLESHAKALAIESRVHFVGYQENVAPFLAAAEALVISSHTEGLPITLLEAMRARLPVISTSVGGIPSVLNNGEFGFLAPANDVQKLSEALELCASNPDLAQSKMEKAYQQFLEEYDSGRMALRYENLYEKAISDAG